MNKEKQTTAFNLTLLLAGVIAAIMLYFFS